MVAFNPNIKFERSSSPFQVIPTPPGMGGNVRVIQGFVSTQHVDREGETVDPAAFNLNQFVKTGAILVNHRPYIDTRGNAIGVGRPVAAYEVKVRKGPDDDSFQLYDVRNNEVVAESWAKANSPELRVGDRGLFAVIELYNPEIISLVDKGVLRAFSWQGGVVREMDISKNRLVKTFSDIDLWEISLVDVPADPRASFAVVKDALVGIQYKNCGRSYAEAASLLVSCKSFSLVPKDSDFYAVAKECKDNPSLFKDCETIVVSKDLTLLVKKEESIMAEDVEKTQLNQDELIAAVTKSAVEQVMAQIHPAISGLTAEVTKMAQALKGLTIPEPVETQVVTEKAAAVVEEKAQAHAPDIIDDPTSERLENMEELVAKMAKFFDNFTPQRSKDEDVIQKSHQAQKVDPFACMDSLFGITESDYANAR